MKTIFFKIGMPVAAIVLAIGGSIVSNAQTEKSPQIIVPGYYNTNPAIPNPCNVSVQCNSVSGPVCTVVVAGITYQAFGKEFTTDTVCPIVLSKLN